MHNDKSERYCRICGLDQGEEGVRRKNGGATFDICDCCGIEFGYGDTGIDYRKYWLYEMGAKWSHPKFKPSNWSLCEQLKNIPKEYLDEWMREL